MNFYILPLKLFYRTIAMVLISCFYKVKFVGFEKIPKTGPALLIANHVSYIDGLIIQLVMKRDVRFVVDQEIYKLPFIHHVMKLTKSIPIFPKKENVIEAMREISSGLESGHIVGIFPEGQITYTGNLGRFKPGIEWIIDRDPVPIYPIALNGLWGSIFSRKYIKSRFRFFPRRWRMEIEVICGDELQPKDASVDRLQQTILRILENRVSHS